MEKLYQVIRRLVSNTRREWIYTLLVTYGYSGSRDWKVFGYQSLQEFNQEMVTLNKPASIKANSCMNC